VARARSVWFAAPRLVEVRDEELPRLGPSDVRIEAVASAISHGTEMLVYRGQVPPELELDLPTLRGSFSFPITYGYASVGRVVETGAAAANLSIGDLVFTLHPHQSAYVVPAALPTRLPSNLDPLRGVFLANLETAITVTLDAAPRLGERVLVLGQGVVGLLIARLLRAAGACLVMTVDGFERRRALSRAFAAADAVLEPGPDLADRVRALTGGRGADLVVEASSNPAALAGALESVVFGGTVIVCSWYGTKPVSVPLGGPFHRRRLRLVSSQVGTLDPSLQPRWTRERRLDLARRYLAELDLTTLISHRFALPHAADAYALVDTHPEETVQVVFTYDACSK
jgi:2-desacetyl-2-hydroxyethyl bacteriochlorophyllide A dehydrogenase